MNNEIESINQFIVNNPDKNLLKDILDCFTSNIADDTDIANLDNVIKDRSFDYTIMCDKRYFTQYLKTLDPRNYLIISKRLSVQDGEEMEYICKYSNCPIHLSVFFPSSDNADVIITSKYPEHHEKAHTEDTLPKKLKRSSRTVAKAVSQAIISSIESTQDTPKKVFAKLIERGFSVDAERPDCRIPPMHIISQYIRDHRRKIKKKL